MLISIVCVSIAIISLFTGFYVIDKLDGYAPEWWQAPLFILWLGGTFFMFVGGFANIMYTLDRAGGLG